MGNIILYVERYITEAQTLVTTYVVAYQIKIAQFSVLNTNR